MSNEKPLIPLETRPHSMAGSAMSSAPPAEHEPDQHEQEHWNLYLKSLARPEGPLTSRHAEYAVRFWHSLRSRFSVPLPQAGPTEAPGLLLVWDRGRHHLQIEIFEDGSYDWFYRDRRNETYLGEEGLAFETRPQELLDRLRFFYNGSS